MGISNKKLIGYFSNPYYLSSLFSPSHPFTSNFISKTLNPYLPHTPSRTLFHSHQIHAKPTSNPIHSSLSSSGSPSFFSMTSPIYQSLFYPSHSLKSHGQYRFFSVQFSDKNSEFDNLGIVGSDSVGGFASNMNPKQISDIIEVVKRGEDDLEFKLNTMCINLSVESLSGIFCVLNCERVSGLRFFDWAREMNPRLYYSADVCSLIIDNCGWLDDYETMRSLLKGFRSKRICLTEKAFGFLPVLGSSKVSVMESIRRVVELLNEVGGSCCGSGICGLLKMLSKLDLFEMAKFVIEITERKVTYYNILILEKCRRCCFEDARGLLEEMRQFSCNPSAQTYNYLLSALCKNDRTEEAGSLLEEMKEKDCPSDALTFEILIYFSWRLYKLDSAVQIFDQMVSMGLEPRLATHAAFIKGYFYSGRYKEAYNYAVDSGLKYKQSGHMIYSLLASLHQRKGDLITAGNILIEMMDKGLIPYFPVYIRILKRLHKTGWGQLARDLKIRFSRLRSESGTVT